MVLGAVSVHWIVHGSGSSIGALDSTWFWEQYQCTGYSMVLEGVSVCWIVHGSERSISALDSIWFWEEYQCIG